MMLSASSFESCLEIDTEESEDEDGDDSSWQGSDEENKINKKKGRSKAKGRKTRMKAVCHHLFCLYLFHFDIVLTICSIFVIPASI